MSEIPFQCIQYFFGEISSINTSRIYPETENKLKDHLDGILPIIVEKAEQAAGSVRKAEELCQEWKESVDDIGFISICLTDDSGRHNEYEQLICKVYFNWASGGRISRSGHAIILSSKQWRLINYDPFSITGFFDNTRFFDKLNLNSLPKLNSSGDFSSDDRNVEFSDRNASLSNFILFNSSTLYKNIRILINNISENQRRKLSFWVGKFGIKEDFHHLFNFGQGKDGDSGIGIVSISNNIHTLELIEKFKYKLPLGNVKEDLKKNKKDLLIIKDEKQESSSQPYKSTALTPYNSPGSRDDGKFNWKRFMSLSFAMVSMFFIFLYMIMLLINDQVNYKDWGERVSNRDEGVIELILDGIDIKNDSNLDVEGRRYVDEKVSVLFRELESSIAQLSSSNEDIADVNSMIRSVHRIKEKDSSEHYRAYFSYNKVLNALYENEYQKFLDITRDQSLEEKKESLSSLKQSYSSMNFRLTSPYLDKIENDILQLESKLALDVIVNSWNPIEKESSYIAIENLIIYKKNHPRYFKSKINDFEYKIYDNYSKLILSETEQKYDYIKNNIASVLSDNIFFEYETDVKFLPLDLLKDLPVLDKNRFENYLKNENYIEIINNDKWFNIYRFNGSCEKDIVQKITVSFHQKICIVKHDKSKSNKNKNTLQVNSISSKHTVLDLIETSVYKKSLTVNIKWPNIKNYVSQ